MDKTEARGLGSIKPVLILSLHYIRVTMIYARLRLVLWYEISLYSLSNLGCINNSIKHTECQETGRQYGDSRIIDLPTFGHRGEPFLILIFNH